MAKATWNISNMERHLSDGSVYTVHWTASLEEDGESAGCYGSVGLGDPDPKSFVPFEKLTEEKVVEWVLSALGVDRVVSIEEGLHNQIQERLNPVDASGTPW
jgi:hypothetical protein